MSGLPKLSKFQPLLSSPALIKRLNNHKLIAQCVPARSRVSNIEMIGLGSIMVSCWLATPMYILYNLKYYNGSVQRT